ncbi:MAG: MerR family transcriptional regulator [Eubacteriaceae bacterium]|nr:MerR family transcriptional regulator [Eubacteriaceae bacterium]
MTISEVSRLYNISADTLRYYEKAGMIPPVGRTDGGIRDYGEADCSWVELAICLRSAGLSVEAIAEYVRLSLEGEDTITPRLLLLKEQRELLMGKYEKMRLAMERLDYKILKYEQAQKSGVLEW